MADRVLVTVTDARDPRHTLVVERSAAGAPGGLVITYFEGEEQGCVVVDDLYDLLLPVVAWLEAMPSHLPDKALVQAHQAAIIRADHLMHEIRRRVLAR